VRAIEFSDVGMNSHVVDHWEDVVTQVVARFDRDASALLEILVAIQEGLGWISAEVMDRLASELNLSRAEVYGVVEFYKDLRVEPGGRITLRLCKAEACQSMGARDIWEHALGKLGLSGSGTTNDGRITLEEVYCLGNCALAPSAMVGGKTIGRVTKARLDEIITDALAGEVFSNVGMSRAQRRDGLGQAGG